MNALIVRIEKTNKQEEKEKTDMNDNTFGRGNISTINERNTIGNNGRI
jgi:hypothetical protein